MWLDQCSPVYHCIRMITHAIQYKQFNVVSSVKCFILTFKTWKKFAVHEDNREHKVFYINMVWNFFLFFISMGLIFSSTAHISWNGSLHKTLYIYYMMMRDTEMKIDSPKNKQTSFRRMLWPVLLVWQYFVSRDWYNKCCSESKSIFVNKWG